MTARQYVLAEELDALYHETDGDTEFEFVLSRTRVTTDRELADLIEADGRLRIRLRRPVTLDRYLSVVPDLPGRHEPLDAAIDMALRDLARTGRADDAAINELIERHPTFSMHIRDAAALNNALWSTEQVRQHFSGSQAKLLPRDFGPSLADGVQRYDLRELLGEGAFGQVYLAIDRQLSEKDHPAVVSIKLLSGEGHSPETRQQLIDEATKARRISHPNVAQVLDLGTSDENEHFVVFEYVAGGDLARWARGHRSSVNVRQAVQLVSKITRGVHAAHMAGLVHCDLKPNNIVLTSDGEPKVADFGVAVRADEDRKRTIAQGCAQIPVGNLAFMSPEQFRMEPGALTIPTDIYAIGGILYWLLTGVLPNGVTPAAIRRAHDLGRGRTAPPRMRPHCPGVDRDLEAICRRAMAISPDQRFSSAAEIADSLDAWLRREPIAWSKPSVLRRTVLWTKRKPAIATAIAVMLILSLAGGAALRHLSLVARRERFETALAEAKLKQEEMYRAEFRVRLGNLVRRLKEAHDEGFAHEVLPQIWLTEWLFGPTVLDVGPEWLILWDLRLDVVRDLVERYRKESGPYAFQTLLWETALGFWLVGENQPGEAEALLEGNLERWGGLLDPSDPWLTQVQAMKDCATVGRAAGGDPLQQLDLAALESRLAVHERTLDETEPGSPLHHLLLVHLQRLYGPELVDSPERLAEIGEILERVTE